MNPIHQCIESGGTRQDLFGGVIGLSKKLDDAAYVALLFHQHGRALLAYAVRLTGDRRRAEDVVGAALLHAWRHPDTLPAGRAGTRLRLFALVKDFALSPTEPKRPSGAHSPRLVATAGRCA